MNETNAGIYAPLELTLNQLKRIFDLMPDLVYVLNLDAQNIQYTNTRLLDVLGYTPDDVAEMGYTLAPVMVHDDMDALAVQLSAEFDNLSADGKTEFIIHFRHKNGDIKTLRNRASVITHHPDGRNHLVVVVAEDVTQARRYEQLLAEKLTQLERTNAELEQFAYVASHDLQEPLRKIISFGERLERRYAEKLGEEGRFFVERMTNASQRMHVLIQDLLAYSRVSRHDELFETVKLDDVFAQILSDLELRIQQKNATIVFGKLPNIAAKPTQIYQLFQNLLTNALKFTRTEVTPLITVESRMATPDELQTVLQITTTTVPYHRIRVWDNGIGFDNEYAEQIFMLFQRLHGRAEYDGTGLGLAICRKIVERHHGHIAAQGQLEVGTEFVVYLPETQIDLKN